MKTCNACHQGLNDDAFYTDRTGYAYITCNACRRTSNQIRDNARRKARKEKIVEMLGGVCRGCGGTFPAPIYDLHHVDPAEKEITPAHLYDKPWAVCLREAAKCVLLCANCHRAHETGVQPWREGDARGASA